MKLFRSLLLLTVLCCAQNAMAQIVIGIKGGPNFSKLPMSGDFEDKNDFKIAWHAGIYGMFALGYGDFILQPELLYSKKGANEYMPTSFETGAFADPPLSSRLNYLSMPLMVGYYPFGNWRIEVGPQFGLLLNDKSIDESENEYEDLIADESFDFGIAGGIVYDWTGPGTIGFRYVHGLSDVKSSIDVNGDTGTVGATGIRENRLLQVFISFPIYVINRGNGCPTFKNEVDLNKKPKKAQSGLMPSNGKKYIKKNSKSLRN